MDLIEKLLLSSRFDTILVIVNQLTKQAIFIPAHNTIMSTDLACMFILYIFSKHSVSSHVTSNRGLEFVLKFFCPLDITLKIQLYFTSGYHSKDNQSRLLFFTEFSQNMSAITSVFLFFTNQRYHPNITFHPEYDIASFQACNFDINLNELQNIQLLCLNNIIRSLLMCNVSLYPISK